MGISERSIVDASTPVADILRAHPNLVADFEELGIDYCCGGARRLDEACLAAGVDVEKVTERLGSVAPPVEAADWTTADPAELTVHVESTHHVYLRRVLPGISTLAERTVGAHGERHPEVVDVRETFERLRAELEPHLSKEEQILFPMIREIASADSLPASLCGSVANPIAVMCSEHDAAGELLARLRALTAGYEPPDDACTTFRALYDGLAELEADTHLHIHKENNLLFPAATAREAELRRGATNRR